MSSILRNRYATKLRVLNATLLPAALAPHKTRLARNQAHRRGQLFEAWAQERLGQQYGQQHLQGAWLHYTTQNGQGNLQIDAIVFDLSNGKIYVIEVKLAHTATAQQQLLHCYIPALRAAMGRNAWLFDFIPVEICGRFDVAEECHIQGGSTLRDDLRQCAPNTFNVMVWRKPKW